MYSSTILPSRFSNSQGVIKGSVEGRSESVNDGLERQRRVRLTQEQPSTQIHTSDVSPAIVETRVPLGKGLVELPFNHSGSGLECRSSSSGHCGCHKHRGE